MVRQPALSAADRDRLTAIIAAGERRTAADLVLVVADSCGGYGAFALLWPALAALLTGALAALFFSAIAVGPAFLAQAVVFLAFGAVLQWRPALLATVPRRVRRAEARQVADHQFALRVAGRTSGRTGLLFMVALAEREVFILPDQGLASIGAAEWQGIVDRLTAAMRHAPAAAAIASALEEVIDRLAQHVPRRDAGPGELPDVVVELGREGEGG